jgi:hypothetical protein
MKTLQLKHFSAILFVSLLFSCDSGPVGAPDPSDPQPVLKILTVTDVSETGFQINWSIENPFGFQSIAVQLARNEDLSQSLSYVLIDDVSTTQLLVENLDGATEYFYKVYLLNNGNAVAESEVKIAETAYYTESIELTTGDDFTLTGSLAYLKSVQGRRPGIIMMHEFGVWVNPWVGSDLLKHLVADGYICLTFFFRGHGTSTPVDDLMDLINNRNLIAEDLKTAVAYLNAHEMVSQGELGLVGASMGATMALAGNGYEEVLTSVALSPVREGVYLLFPDMTLKSAYYLVGELDIAGDPAIDFLVEAQNLYELTEEPRKLNNIPGTADHGTELLSRDSLNTSIETWFLEKLPME